jgi:chromosomal replication initiator protein
VNDSEIKSKTRTKKIVIARHIAMYFCREKLGYSYSRIAREFGGMDHTSVSDGCKKAQQLYLNDNDVKYYIDEIKRMIG